MNSSEYLRSISTTFVLSFVAIHGCTPGDQFATVSAEGTVTRIRKPPSDAQVWLLPKGATHRAASLIVRAQGRTEVDCNFVLTKYNQNDGKPEGEYNEIVRHSDNDLDVSL